MNVFEHIKPSALVLVEADPCEAVDRIKRRDERQIDVALIQRLLFAEREHGHAISKAIGVPIIIVDGSIPTEDIVAFLRAASSGN